MKRILAIAASLALAFAMTSCNQNKTTMEQITPNPENAAKAQQFIKEVGTYYLATAEENGQAHVRAFGTADIFEGKLYMLTGKVKNVYKQLIANPKAEICCYNPGTGQWLRICGELIPDERIEAKSFVLEKNPSLKSSYKADDDNIIVFYFRNATATVSSFAGDVEKYQF